MTSNSESDAKFEEAVKQYLTAQGYDDGLVVDWFLITAQHMVEEDGAGSTALSVFGPYGQPIYRAAGLIQYALNKINERFLG